MTNGRDLRCAQLITCSRPSLLTSCALSRAPARSVQDAPLSPPCPPSQAARFLISPMPHSWAGRRARSPDPSMHNHKGREGRSDFSARLVSFPIKNTMKDGQHRRCTRVSQRVLPLPASAKQRRLLSGHAPAARSPRLRGHDYGFYLERPFGCEWSHGNGSHPCFISFSPVPS
jgi:hypothetical protein